MTPFALMATKAETICLRMDKILSGDRVFYFLMNCERSPPSQYSMMMLSSSFYPSKWC